MALPAIAAGAMRIGAMFSRGVGKSGGLLRRAILKKTKVKRESIAREKVLNKRSLERRRRRDKESLLESFRTRGKSGMTPDTPGKSFLQRVLEFIGVLLIGWLVDKLPQIIKWIEDFKKRVELLVDSLKNFIKNLGDWMKSIGNVVISTLENWSKFDFSDNSGKVDAAMKDLENAFKGMEDAVDDAKTAVTGTMEDVETTSAEKEIGPVDPAVTGSKEEKWKQFYSMAEKAGAKYPELVAAQFALESNWGSAISGTHNYFGMKASESESGTVKGTQEVYGGQTVNTAAKFKNYSSAQDSVNELVQRWYKNYKGYTGVNNAKSAYSAADMLKSEGYATDPIYASKLKRIMKQNASITNTMKSGSGDGRKPRTKSQTPAYSTAVEVGKQLVSQGYSIWQHPDFNVNGGYTGSGRERVMRRSYNSYHNYGEALDFPMSHNTAAQLDTLASYFRQNKSQLGVAEVLWRGAPGHDPDMSPNSAHLHVSFKGGGSISKKPTSMPSMGAGVGQPQNTILIIEEEAPPPMMMGGSGGSSPVIVMGESLNSIIKKQLLTSLAYT